MRCHLESASFLLFVPSLLAQGVVPPQVITRTNPQPGLSAPLMPGSNVQQVHMIHLPNDPPNVYLCAATLGGLSSTYGGVGGTDLVTGRYDVLTDTFTPNAEAGPLNTTGTEFGMMLHHSGRYCVFDRLPGQPWLASRPAVGQPWQIVGQIQLPSQSYYDPALADYQGQTWLLHVNGFDIAMTPIDLNTGALLGSPVTIVQAARPSSTANSPTPIVDPNGQLIGVSHHDVLGSDNDHYMSFDLDPNTPAVLMNDTTTWTNNGGFCGGRFFDAENTPAPYHVFAIDTYWFTGGRAAVGSTMHITFMAPPTTANEIYFSAFAVSDAFLPVGQPFPPVQGLVGVNFAAAVTGPLVLHDNNNGEARVSFVIPNRPNMSGTRLPVQSVTMAALAGQLFFGNTALLAVD